MLGKLNKKSTKNASLCSFSLFIDHCNIAVIYHGSFFPPWNFKLSEGFRKMLQTASLVKFSVMVLHQNIEN